MQTFISGATRVAYSQIAKPILFRFQPDDVHSRLLKSGTRLQHHKNFLRAIESSWKYSSDEKLKQKVCGITFPNPVGLSAGFDKNFELVPLLRAIGFGFMEGGSITFRECAGNPRPWFHRLPNSESLVVYAGLANNGVHKVIETLQDYPVKTFDGFPLNISVAKTNSQETCSESDAIADYIGSLKLLQQAGIGDIYTLNISCPNTYGGEPFTTPKKLTRLLNAVDKLNLRQPVFIKMPAHLEWRDFKKLLEVANNHQVSGVTISNLAKDRGRAQLMDELPDSIKGNLSGKPTYDLSNNLIRRTYRDYGDRFVIIGVGGIFSSEDAFEKIKLGATLVELITGMIFQGPQLIGQINKGLVKLLQQNSVTSIRDVVGIDA